MRLKLLKKWRRNYSDASNPNDSSLVIDNLIISTNCGVKSNPNLNPKPNSNLNSNQTPSLNRNTQSYKYDGYKKKVAHFQFTLLLWMSLGPKNE